MNVGLLEVVVGPMFSGKTETLIKRVHQFRQKSLWKVAVFKPITDTRHPTGKVISHAGSSVDAQWIHRDAPDLPRDVHLIALDEVQFFSSDAIPRILEVLRAGVHVLAVGLDLTYRGEPFGPVPALMCLADSVEKLTGTCGKCGQPASRTQRLVASAETVLIGGSEAYEPRCVVCFDPG